MLRTALRPETTHKRTAKPRTHGDSIEGLLVGWVWLRFTSFVSLYWDGWFGWGRGWPL